MRLTEWLGFAMCLALGEARSNPEKSALVADILYMFNGKRCVWFDNKLADVGLQVKYLSERNIMTVVLNHTDLTHRLLRRRPYPHLEVLVIDFFSIDWRWFHPSQRAQISSLAWVVFFRGNWGMIQTLPVPYDCCFIIAVKSEFGYHLFEFYSLKGYPFLRFYGDWSAKTGLVLSSIQPFLKRRYNFNGAQLVLLRNQEWTYASDHEKANIELWFSMGKILNFSTLVVEQHSAEDLAKNEGIFPDVSSQVTVFHSTALTQNPSIYYSIAPIWKISMFMYVEHEIDGISQWTAYFRVFPYSIWLITIFLSFLSSICLIMIVKTTSNSCQSSQLVEYWFSPMDMISNQCGSLERKQLSYQIVTAFFRLQCLVLFHAFSGMLTSTLTLQLPKYPFKDLAGFVEDGSYKLGAINGTFGIGYFQYSNNPIDQMIATKLFEKESTLPTNSKEGLHRCCLSHFAFLANDIDLKEVQNKFCRILKIPTPAFTTFAGMALAPFSEFKPVFFNFLIQMQQSGIIDKLKRFRHPIDDDNSEYYSVDWDRMYPILAMLTIGICLSCVIFITEQFFNQNNKKIDPLSLIVYDGLCYNFPESKKQELFKQIQSVAYTNTKKKFHSTKKQLK